MRTFPLGWMLAPSTLMEMGIQAKDAVAHAAHRWLAGYAWDPAAAPAGTPRVWPGVPVGAQTVSR